jgi:hypothetical protein
MPKKPVNHPPAPVSEGATGPAVVQDPCEELKQKYGLNVNTYSRHKGVKTRTNQSHHVLQDATVSDYISKGMGLCVLLANSKSGTPHQVTTAEQNKRRDNKKYKKAGAKPAKTFGQLKKLSAADLEKSFKKAGIPDEDAKTLAECLVAEAEKQINKQRERDGEEPMKDSDEVKPTGGCFPARTLVWLDQERTKPVRRILHGEAIDGRHGVGRVIRRDWCRSELVHLHVASGVVAMAPFHRVLTADLEFRRVDELRPGMEVATHWGPAPVHRIELDTREQRIYGLGLEAQGTCRLGGVGLWVELTHAGAAVTKTIRSLPTFAAGAPFSDAAAEWALF